MPFHFSKPIEYSKPGVNPNANYGLWVITMCWCGFTFFFFLLGPHPQHMEVPRLGVRSELQLLAYTIATATATWDLSRIFNLTATLDPSATEPGQGLNPQPHGS